MARCFLFLLLIPFAVSANNLRIQTHAFEEYSEIKLSVFWDDSWYLPEEPPFNHDAVWIFVKVRPMGGEWHHQPLSSDLEEHISPTEILIEPVPDEAGVFIRRSTAGTGNIHAENITLKLAEPLTGNNYDFRVYGIEMAFIPKGPFYLGDGVSINSYAESGSNAPFFIESSGTINVDTSTGSGQYLTSLGDAPPENDIPDTFPNGFDGFYLMKHAITQRQYADFLNALTYTQQNARTTSSPDDAAGTPALAGRLHGSRNNIAIKQPGKPGEYPAVYGLVDEESGTFTSNNDGRYRACNFLKWADLSAYLAWAGLRPITDFEYEKAARGPNLPVQGEFAWGTPSVTNAKTPLFDGTGEEAVVEQAGDSSGLALHGYNGVRGPLRAGFAGTGATGRIQTGTGYYGHFDLSGNTWELAVVPNYTGLRYHGTPGSGKLSKDGYATEANWPEADGYGAGYRGGGWNSGIYQPGNFRDLAVSDRFYGFQKPDIRTQTSGGRGGR